MKWLNLRESKQLHPIIVSAIAHHRIVSIHPFSDGNCRVSRALGIWLLYVRGFDTQHLFSLAELENTFKITRARVHQIITPLLDAGLILRFGKTRSTSYRLA